jgi:hypothetical protein
MKMKVGLSAAGVALAMMCGTAQAVPVANNQTVTPDTLATALGGSLLASLVESINAPTFSGTFRTAVYDGPEAGRNLDFYYQFSNSANSANSIGRVTGYDFDGFTTNVSQTARAFGIFLAGDRAANTADRGPIGVVGFNMLPGANQGKLLPGEDSYTFIVRTNATDYTTGWSGIINGTAATAHAFQPAPAVPEPGTNALIAAGLGLMGFIVRRRTKRQSPAA